MNDIFKLPPKEVDISLILFSVVNIVDWRNADKGNGNYLFTPFID